MSFLVDCLLSAERQSNIKENNLNTLTIKVDIMDNSSDNSVNNRLKQELSESGKNAREYQPATSFKCLYVALHSLTHVERKV